eukprot:Skav230418  [mRNA]  locus=scaffold4006:128639:131642:- [translate_table: standard]
MRDVGNLRVHGSHPNLHLVVQASKFNDFCRDGGKKLVLFHTEELGSFGQISCYSERTVSAVGAHLKASHGFLCPLLGLNFFSDCIFNLQAAHVPFLGTLCLKCLVPKGIHRREDAVGIARLCIGHDVFQQQPLQAVHSLAAHSLDLSLGLCRDHVRCKGSSLNGEHLRNVVIDSITDFFHPSVLVFGFATLNGCQLAS